MRKKIILILLCFTYIVLVCGCEAEKNDNINPSTMDMMSHVISESEITSPYNCYAALDDVCRKELMNFYGFDENTINTISDITIVRSEGVSSEEYFIAKTNNVSDAKIILQTHLDTRIGDFMGYAPDETEKLLNAELISKNDYVALFVSNNSSLCKKAFDECMNNSFTLTTDEQSIKIQLTKNVYEEETSKKENGNAEASSTEKNVNSEVTSEDEIVNSESETEDILVDEIQGVIEPYDTSLILEAYRTKNPDILNDEKDIAVLNACVGVIINEINDDMSDFEKELAIHDYIVEHTDYDENALQYSNKYTQYADQPYGTLINKEAICLGYSTTFKLFMDMLNIECIIVKGSAHSDNANHAWNLVKLDNSWYAVDVTWDDPVSIDEVIYPYFNVTDKVLLDSSHHWNQDEYPSATGGEYSDIVQ